MAKRRYYIIKENGKWKVKLENGPVLSTHGGDRSAATKEAKRLGRSNNRPVMRNYADGRTGETYWDETEL